MAADAVDLQKILKSLGAMGAIFTSERDFQFHLAWELKSFGCKVHLEHDPGCFKKNAAVDLLITDPERVAIELKYNTAALRHGLIVLKEHPRDTARYSLLADIVRLEAIVEKTAIRRAVSILLTNAPRLWTDGPDESRNCSLFSLNEGRTITGQLTWSERSGADTLTRYPALSLKGSYKCKWSDYLDLAVPNGLFRTLVTEVKMN